MLGKEQTQNINNSGFTIIEIVIVMLIISIVLALTIPNFNKILGVYQLDISARQMVSDIRDLQQAAMKAQNADYAIVWNTSGGAYYLMNNIKVNKTVQLPQNVEITAAPYISSEVAFKMHFATGGRPVGGIGGTVILMDRNTGKNKYIIINTLGRVRVSETPPAS